MSSFRARGVKLRFHEKGDGELLCDCRTAGRSVTCNRVDGGGREFTTGLTNMDLAINLKAAEAKFAGDARKLVSTCGGLFGVVGTARFPGRRNLLTGKDVPPDPYAWFRCSADRSVTAGIMESDRALYVGSATGGASWRGRVLRIQHEPERKIPGVCERPPAAVRLERGWHGVRVRGCDG